MAGYYGIPGMPRAAYGADVRLDPAREAEPESELLLRPDGGRRDRTGAEDPVTDPYAAVGAWALIENHSST